jgi:hypothetical protein
MDKSVLGVITALLGIIVIELAVIINNTSGVVLHFGGGR